MDLPGYVSDSRLDALMRGADLMVYPSLYEGFGLAVVEAMARGIPVAASDTTALPEAGAGRPSTSTPPMRTTWPPPSHAVLADPERRTRMAELGHRRAAELTWERTAKETAAVYRELL